MDGVVAWDLSADRRGMVFERIEVLYSNRLLLSEEARECRRLVEKREVVVELRNEKGENGPLL